MTDPYYYGPLPGWVPPPPEPRWPKVRAGLVAGVAAALLVILLGAPVAFLWRAVAPAIDVARTAQGPQPTAVESSQVFAVDGSYAVVTIGIGVLAGIAAWPLLRGRGPAGPAGLAAGGLVAAYVTSAVGDRIVVDRYLYAQCRAGCYVYTGTLRLHAHAAVVLWPAAMLAAFALLTFFFDREHAT